MSPFPSRSTSRRQFFPLDFITGVGDKLHPYYYKNLPTANFIGKNCLKKMAPLAKWITLTHRLYHRWGQMRQILGHGAKLRFTSSPSYPKIHKPPTLEWTWISLKCWGKKFTLFQGLLVAGGYNSVKYYLKDVEFLPLTGRIMDEKY